MIDFKKICLKSEIDKWNLMVNKVNKKSISLALCPNFGIILSEYFQMEIEYHLISNNNLDIGLIVGLRKKNKFFSMPLLCNGGVFLFDGINFDKKKIYNKFFSKTTYNFVVKSFEKFSEYSTSNKITVFKYLPENEDCLIIDFKSKLRSQIKKAYKNNLKVKINHFRCLNDFYNIYSKGLHRLGTPVPGISFFSNFQKSYPKDRLTFFTVFYNDKPIGTSICFMYNNFFEVMWASTITDYNYLNTNMILYYEMMKHATIKKNKIFSFGRSNANSGSLRFKRQWQVEEHQIFNNYNKPTRDIKNYKFLTSIWKLFPYKLTLMIGPILRKYIIN